MATSHDVDGVPVLRIDCAQPHGVALWLPPFTATKESVLPALNELAQAGLTAISIDPWDHGERARESPEELSERVFSNFRRHMWTILGQTTLDGLRVLDWAVGDSGAGAVVVGGISMGGDIGVALSGVDHRISRVAVIGASPDWSRPGMRDLDDPSLELDQGAPDSSSRWLYEQFDPTSNLDRFRRRIEMTFQCGADDKHISPEWTAQFRAALTGTSINIDLDLHDGLDHRAVCSNDVATNRALGWLVRTDCG
jgi:uncharacterized protein